MEFPTYILMIIFFVLLLISSFFSISETSLMAINKYKLKHLAKLGNKAAKRTEKLLKNKEELLGVILLGNNLSNTAAASLITFVFIKLIGQSELALTASTLFVTIAILIFSEITPKIIGANYPEKIAFPASFILLPLLKLGRPVVSFTDIFVKGISYLLNLGKHKKNESLNLEELRTLILDENNFLPKNHKSILLNLFDLQSINVEDIMIHKNKIEAIDITQNQSEIFKNINASNYTRIPIYKGNIDEIIGIIHIRKLLNRAEGELFSIENISEVMRDPYFIPLETPILTQLQNMKNQNERMALVVDEYGELMGLITIEDIIEEMIGELKRDSSINISQFKYLENGSIIVEGSTLIRDINKHLDFKFPLSGPKTINGLITEYLQDLPEQGTSVKIKDCPIEILHTENHIIKSVLLKPRIKENK